MHHHGGAGSPGSAWLNLLPLWLQVGWVLVLAVVTAWAVLSLVFLRGSLRLAAALHALAGVGMLDMFAPWTGATGRNLFWQVIFGTASAVAMAGLIRAHRLRLRTRSTVAMWALVTADCLAMSYMFLLPEHGFSPVNYALIAVFALLGLGWAAGVFDPVHAPMCGRLPSLSARVTAGRIARFVQAGMAMSMAYMVLLMDPRTGDFFGKAFKFGVTQQTYWALALVGLFARVAADPRLVRQLMGGVHVIVRRPPAPAAPVAIHAHFQREVARRRLTTDIPAWESVSL